MHHLFENIKAWLIEQLTGKPPAAAPAQATAALGQIGHDHAQSIVPFDKTCWSAAAPNGSLATGTAWPS